MSEKIICNSDPYEDVLEAKKHLIANVSSNVLLVIVISLIGFWMTPYLIRHMGVAVWSMVPLMTSVVSYFGLLTSGITSAVGRFVGICLKKGDNEGGNIYFNSAFFGMLFLFSFLSIFVFILTVFLHRIFRIPEGYEFATRVLFVFIVVSTFLTALSSPFFVSAFVRHRFDLGNLAGVVSRFFRVGLMVFCFTYFGASLVYVGLSYLGMTLILFVSLILLTRILTPELHVRWKFFKRGVLYEMGVMSGWITVDQIGTLLYLSIDLIIINLFLGAEAGGRYAPILQLVLLLQVLSFTIGGIFAPVAYSYIANNEIEALSRQAGRSIKYVGLIMALFIGGMCGFSKPLLECWLGPSFAELNPLLWLLAFPQAIFLAINPLYNINRGMNKVSVPAIATVIGGVLNLVLSILLVKYTTLGLYGVAIATVFSYAVRCIFFTPIYTALILGQSATSFIKKVVPGLIMSVVVGLVCLVLSRTFYLASYLRLAVVGFVVCVLYIPLCYAAMLDRSDRAFLWSLAHRKKQ